MSIDVFVQRFINGEPQPLPPDTARRLSALGGRGEPDLESLGFWKLRAGDGGADLYGLIPPVTSLIWNRIDGKLVWNLLFTFVDRTDAVVIAPGRTPVVSRHELVAHLPRELSEDCAVVGSGLALRQLLTDE